MVKVVVGVYSVDVKKSKLGQHFLNSESALKKIVGAARLTKKDVILEIGPGKGALTKELLLKTKKVVAVEKDRKLIEFLKEKFESEIKEKKLILINEDALKTDSSKLKLKKYKVVANIPYYITGKLLRKILSEEKQPQLAVLLLQNEVAERISKDKKESLLSLSIKVYGEPSYIGTVSAKKFNPPPKVDSAILLIDNISRNFFKEINEEKFFELIREGFRSKRKKLINNLSKFGNKEKLERVFYKSGIKEGERAENISALKFKSILRNLD